MLNNAKAKGSCLEVWRKKIQNSEEGEEEGSGEKKTKKNKNKNKENSYMTAAAKALAAVKRVIA